MVLRSVTTRIWVRRLRCGDDGSYCAAVPDDDASAADGEARGTVLRPLMSPTTVATRLPRPTETADTINGFMRIEAGGWDFWIGLDV